MSQGRIVGEQTQNSRSSLRHEGACASLVQADVTARRPPRPTGPHGAAVPTLVELGGNSAGLVLDQFQLIGKLVHGRPGTGDATRWRGREARIQGRRVGHRSWRIRG
jgi:hypothetical protein